MNNGYTHYNNVTREILDTIKVGDLIKVNDWDTPMEVKSVSENYFVMTEDKDNGKYYSVCSKLPWDGIRYNSMVGGMFHCGTDNWVFGSSLQSEYENVYYFENEECNKKYLEEFEQGECELSFRTSIAIYDLYVKTT